MHDQPVLRSHSNRHADSAAGRRRHALAHAACCTGLALASLLGATAAQPATRVSDRQDLGNMSLEQLSEVKISSVSGRPEPLSKALGSVYVISGDDLRRSGVSSLPEALQLAPNLQVAQIGPMGYAVTARGFNSLLANKLLVLLDGRSLYTPTFSGVFWEVHDVVLDDVDRIEVISGPGGVLWGANAVNGVINIVTRSSADTQGALAGAGVGSDESGLFARYGGALDGGHYRVYAKHWRWDGLRAVDDTDLHDGWSRRQAGFRADWSGAGDGLTVQGDVYSLEGEQTPTPSRQHGANLLARWEHEIGAGDSVRLQAYVDRSSRPQQRLETADVDLQYTLAPRGSHRLLVGGGLRRARDQIQNSDAIALLPADKTLRGWTLFVLDEVAVGREVDVTIGAKVDHNVYTGSEFLPSVRLGWRPSPRHLLWAASSRAVRAPSRFDRELFLPGRPPFLLTGGPEFRSEIALVHEIGYRGQPTPDVSLSATFFFHDLDLVRTVGPVGGAAQVQNNREGFTRGVETWGSVQVTSRWRLQAGYTHLETRLRPKDGQVDLQPLDNLGADPGAWWKLRSMHELGGGWELDLLARHYGALAYRNVPGYTAVDLRAGRRVAGWDVSLLLQNVFDAGHVEWAPQAAELRRAAFVKLLRRF